jgi:protein SCO1
VTISARALFAFSVAAVILWTSCTHRTSSLPKYGVVPDFKLTDSEGHSFTSSLLKGKVWVADFIYTSCPGPCPMMTSRLHKVQQQVRGDSDVRLVSISVDPQHDSPAALNDFARRFGGPTEDWVFLTGSPETIHLLAHDVFHLGDLIGNMDHSTKFVLVDKQRTIRGYYSSEGGEGVSALLRDIRALRKESS